MKKFNKNILVTLGILSVLGLFGTITVFAAGPAKVNLGTASNFAILTKAGITNVPTSIIVGNVGASPISGTAIGLTCAEITGTTYSVNATGPLPCITTNPTLLTTAVSNMEAAYTDAATRTPATGANLNIGGGTVSTQTLAPGLYTWTTPTTITGDITLSGSASDVWIFQVNGTLDLAANKNIILTGGALAENVFWQSTETVNIMAGANFAGNILAKTDIAMRSGAKLNGRALSQTMVTLVANTVTIPTTPIVINTPTPTPTPVITTPTPTPTLNPVIISAPIPTVTNIVTPVVTPGLPSTGFAPKGENLSWYQAIISSILNWFN